MKDKSAPRPRVLVMTSTFPRWVDDPEPAFIFELSRRLATSFDIMVLSPRTPGSTKFEAMAGLRVSRFPYFFNRWEKLAMHGGGILNKLKTKPLNYLLVPFFLLGQLIGLIRLLRREPFDLIHAHWMVPQGLIAVVGLAMTRRRIPLLCTSHGGDLFGLRGGVFKHLKRFIMRKSAMVTVVSRSMERMVVEMGVPAEEVRVIPMGVDLRNRFSPDPAVKRSELELLFVGRLVEKKGVRFLLEAMPKVLSRHPAVHVTVAGYGPLEGELRDLARRLNLEEKVDFLGMVAQPKLPELYRRAALAVFPFLVARSGDQEGFGLVQVEAMGCGCPVIAGDLPVIHDTITHGESGFLVPPGNSEELADTIVRALEDRESSMRMAAEARKRVTAQFDWEVSAEKYAAVYYHLIRKSRSIFTGDSKESHQTAPGTV